MDLAEIEEFSSDSSVESSNDSDDSSSSSQFNTPDDVKEKQFQTFESKKTFRETVFKRMSMRNDNNL